MKTNKEIKPFKMRCSKSEIIKVTNILDGIGISKYRCSVYDENHPVIVFSHAQNEYGLLNYIHFNSYSGDELTCSEFMKLYGEEAEVFTREDMVDFANWIMLLSMDYVSMTGMFKPNGDVITAADLLTKFLSERTND